MSTLVDWAQVAVSWVLVQFVSLYAAVFGMSSGVTWTLAFVSIALVITVVLAYPTRKQLEMQRLTWEVTPVTMKIAKAYKKDRVKARAERKRVYEHVGFNMWWQLVPTFLSLGVFLALNSVVEGITTDTAEGVFQWPEYNPDVAAAQNAQFLGAPFSASLQTAGQTPTPWLTVVIILVLLSLMIPVNATLQRQINGPLATNKWMRRQQRFALYSQPVTLLFLVLVLNVAVGTMLFQLACDVFSLAIQTYLLRRKPLPPVDTEWLQNVVAELPTPGTTTATSSAGNPADGSTPSTREARPLDTDP